MKTFRKWQEQQAVNPEQQQAVDPREVGRDLRTGVQRLAVKLGANANKYLPLIKYCSRNPQMIQMLDELISDAGTMQASVGKKLFSGHPQQ
jgi:hypothetical protein